MTTMASLPDKSINIISDDDNSTSINIDPANKSLNSTTISSEPRDIPLVVSSTPNTKPVIVSSSIERRESYTYEGEGGGNGNEDLNGKESSNSNISSNGSSNNHSNGSNNILIHGDSSHNGNINDNINTNSSNSNKNGINGNTITNHKNEPSIDNTSNTTEYSDSTIESEFDIQNDLSTNSPAGIGINILPVTISGPANDIYSYNYGYDGYTGYYLNGSRSQQFPQPDDLSSQLENLNIDISASQNQPLKNDSIESYSHKPPYTSNSASTIDSDSISNIQSSPKYENITTQKNLLQSYQYSIPINTQDRVSQQLPPPPLPPPPPQPQQQPSQSQPPLPPPPPIAQFHPPPPPPHHSPFIYSSDIATFRPNNSYQNDTYTITVTNIPPTYQWKQVRTIISNAAPDIPIIYTKIVSPGMAFITVKGHGNAIACAQCLNGIILPSNHILMAGITSRFIPQSIPQPPSMPQGPPTSLLTRPFDEYPPTSTSSTNSPRTTSYRSLNISQAPSPLPIQSSPVIFSPAIQQGQQLPQYFSPSSFAPPPPPPPQPNHHQFHNPNHNHNQPPPPLPHNNPYSMFSPQPQNASLSSNPYQQHSAEIYPQYYGQSYLPQHLLNAHLPAPYHRSGAPVSDRQRLFIGNIPFTAQWQDLKDFLRSKTNIYRVEIPEFEDGRSKGFAIASFYTEEDAAKAIELFDKSMFKGREINVRYDKYHRYSHPHQAFYPQRPIVYSSSPLINSETQFDENSDLSPTNNE